NVVFDVAEMGIRKQMADILFPPRPEVIEADYLVIFSQQTIAKVGADKTRSSGNEYSHPAVSASLRRDAGRPMQWYSKPSDSTASRSKQLRPSTTIGTATLRRSSFQSTLRNSCHSVR